MARTNYLDIGAVQFGTAKRLDRGAVQRVEIIGASIVPSVGSLGLSTTAPIRQGSSGLSPAVASLVLSLAAATLNNSAVQRNLLVSPGMTGGIYG